MKRSHDDEPAKRGVKAVLWDMDGTIADSEPLHWRTLVVLLDSYGVEADDALFVDIFGVAEDAVHALCERRYGLTVTRPDWVAARNAAYASEAEQLQGRPGVIGLLHRLKRAGVPQAIVSNSSREVLDISLDALCLRDLVPITVSRTEVDRGKPDPASYLLAAARLGVEPAEALVVEDSPTGASAGIAAGMSVVAWPAPEIAPSSFLSAVRLVSSAAELDGLLCEHLFEDFSWPSMHRSCQP